MSKILEVLGKAITVNTSDLIWCWLNAKVSNNSNGEEFGLNDYELELDEILEEMADMDLGQSQKSVQEFLQKYPESTHGRMLAAAILMQKNDLHNSLKQLQSVYLREPNNTMALYAMGYCYERMGQEDQAVEFYQDCIKFKSYLQLPRQRLAAISLRKGQLSSAIQQYVSLSIEYPDDVSSLVSLGYLQLANLDYEAAIDSFNTAILIHPDNFQSDNEHDDIQSMLEEGDLTEALAQTQMLIEQIGEMPDLYVKMGDIFAAGGKKADALSSYEKALQVQPNYMEACLKMGTLHLNNLHYALAAEQFNKAVELNDEVVDAYIGLATAYTLSGNNKEALKTLSFAGSIQQNSTLLFVETASLNYQAALNEGFVDFGMMEERSIIEMVIEAHKIQAADCETSADAHYKLGILFMGTERLHEAISEFKKALEVNSTHHRARTKLAICQYELGQENEAIGTVVEPDILDSELLDLHYRTAVLFADKNTFARSLEKLDRVVKQNCSRSDALTSLQVILENLGLIDRCLTSWERLCFTTNRALASQI